VMTGDERLAIERVVDAARRVANLDMEAAANGLEIHLPDAIKPYALRMAEDAVNAALRTTTEDDDD